LTERALIARKQGGHIPASRKTQSGGKYWSARVTKESDALNLEQRAFTLRDARRVAQSLKRSAERSRRRKGSPFQSATSMPNFYINRAGHNLPATRKRVLQGRVAPALRQGVGRSGSLNRRAFPAPAACARGAP